MRLTEYLITHEGQVKRRTIQEDTLRVPDTLVASLTRDVVKKTYSVFLVQYNGHSLPANLAIADNGGYVTVQLPTLTLTCPFRVTQSGVVTPNLTSKSDPVMTMIWTPPDTMRLLALGYFQPNSRYFITFSNMWLFAEKANEGRFYRLPMGNIYPDCRVCTGLREGFSESNYQLAMNHLLDVFIKSQWNADLWGSAQETQSMFMFKPTTTGFDQQPMTVNWTTISTSSAPNILTRLTI